MFALKEWNQIKQCHKPNEIGSWEYVISENKFIWSEEQYKLFHTTYNDFSHRFEDYLKFIHPDDVEKVRHAFQSVISKPKRYELKYRIIRNDGSECFLLEYGEPIFLKANQKATSIVGVTKNITHKIESEMTLWKSHFNLSQAQKRFGFVNWEYDIGTKKLEWSNGVLDLLGTVPKNIYEYNKLIHPNDIDLVKNAGLNALNGKPFNIEYKIIRPDGLVKTILGQAQVLFSISGIPYRMIGTNLDITERKMTEEFLINSDKLSVVGQLAAGIAHEIRNPLTALKGFIQILESGENKKEYFEIMMDEITRIDFIVSEFLSISKPQSITFERKNIIQILKSVISFLGAHFNLKNVEVKVDFPAEDIILNCVENQLKQLFVNIIKNAIEAIHESGKLTIKVEVKSDEFVYIHFIDNGIGIPSDCIKRLGEPFYSTKENGTGLGLMVCQKIIKNHSGELLIDSVKGVGTIVTVVLPINKEGN